MEPGRVAISGSRRRQAWPGTCSRVCRSGWRRRGTACPGSSAARPGCAGCIGRGRRQGSAVEGAASLAVGCLVGTLGDGVADPKSPQQRRVGAAAVGLVGGKMVGAFAGLAAPARPWDPQGVEQRGQSAGVGGVGGLARGEQGGQVAAAPVAEGVQLGGQPTPRPSESLPPRCVVGAVLRFRAPAACRWARTIVVSAWASQSRSPAVSASSWSAVRIRCCQSAALLGGGFEGSRVVTDGDALPISSPLQPGRVGGTVSRS